MRNCILQIITMFYPFQFSSKASKDEIIKSLHFNVEYNSSHFRSFRSSQKEFEGVIQHERFRFKRIDKKLYNSFLPQAHGEIILDSSSTSIKGVVRCSILVYVIFALSLLMVLIPLTFGLSSTEAYSHSNRKMEEVNQMLKESNLEPIPTREPPVKSYTSVIMSILTYLLLVFYIKYEKEILIENMKTWIGVKEIEAG